MAEMRPSTGRHRWTHTEQQAQQEELALRVAQTAVTTAVEVAALAVRLGIEDNMKLARYLWELGQPHTHTLE